jgi:hypothetical protein
MRAAAVKPPFAPFLSHTPPYPNPPHPTTPPQDGQLDVFMSTARRQIKFLEDEIKQLQVLPKVLPK